MKVEKNLHPEATAEVVAYQLMLHVLGVEGRSLTGGDPKISRNVILDAYADCIEAVRGNRPKRALRVAAQQP